MLAALSRCARLCEPTGKSWKPYTVPKKFKQLADEYFANRYPDNPEESGVDSGALAQSLVSLERDEDLSDRVGNLLATDEKSPPVEVDVKGAAPDTQPSQEASLETPKPNVKTTQPEVDEPQIERETVVSAPLPDAGTGAESIQEPSLDTPEPNIKSTQPEVDEPRIERETAPAVPTPGQGVVEEGIQEPSLDSPEPNVKSTQPEVDEPRIERRPAPSVPTPGQGIVSEGMQEFETPDVRLESSADIEANFAPGIQSTTIMPKDADFDAEGLLAEVEKRVVVTPDSASPILAGVPELEPMPDVNAIIRSVGDQHIAAYSDQVASWERR
jgi:hypothetical protein